MVGAGLEIKAFIGQAWFTMTQAQPMNTQEQFCPSPECKARGRRGAGNITIHSQKRRRYQCTCCGKTFSERTGTMLAGLRTDPALIVIVVTLLAYGCPLQAIVQAYGLDERTVADWRDRAGLQCQAVHDAVVRQGNLDLQHVQVDEIRVKGRGWIAWLGSTLMVSTRLWLGGVVSLRGEVPNISASAHASEIVRGISGVRSVKNELTYNPGRRDRSLVMSTESHARVMATQQALKEKGFDPGPIDGVMGLRTASALKEYQKSEDLKITGKMDSDTTAKLGTKK